MKNFWLITSKCIKRCILKSKINSNNIIAIGMTGNMVGAWPIDYNENPFRNAILWNDTRSEEIFSSFAAWYRSCANLSSTQFNIINIASAPKLLARGIW